MTTQEAISYWCDGDRRLIQAEAYRLTGITPHAGPSLNAFIQVSPRTVTLPSDFLAPAELQVIALIESRAPGNMGTTGGSVTQPAEVCA